MAATTSGAIKSWLESQGLGISVYRDHAPPNATPPYCTVNEAIALSPVYADGVTDVVTEMVQIDLWQSWQTPTKGSAEVSTLPGAILAALQGSRLQPSGSGAPPTLVFNVEVQTMRRMPMSQEMIDDNISQHSFTVLVRRLPG